VITKIAEGGKEDIDIAVKAARVAFDHGPWPRMPGVVRYHFSSSSSIYKELLRYRHRFVGLIYFVTFAIYYK